MYQSVDARLLSWITNQEMSWRLWPEDTLCLVLQELQESVISYSFVEEEKKIDAATPFRRHVSDAAGG